MGGTKEGKKVIEGIVDNVKKGLQEDEFNEAMNELDIDNQGNGDDDSEGGGDWSESPVTFASLMGKPLESPVRTPDRLEVFLLKVVNVDLNDELRKL